LQKIFSSTILDVQMLLNLAANKSKNVVEPAKMHDAVPVLADSPFLSTGVNL